MAAIALVRESDSTVVSTHRTAPGRLDLPGVGQVSPAVVGWKGNGFKIVQFNVAPPPPAGKRRVGGPILTVQANAVTESYQLEDIPVETPEEISDRQFFHGLALNNIITRPEAIAAVATGTIPAEMMALVNAIPDLDQRFAAQMHLSGSTIFQRHHPFTEQFSAAYGWTAEQTDAFWQFCSEL
jgi:hypothetical protein